ncbi:MAG TPA: SRPBCC domain-containing protein [Polyangia bacterium]|nr:SRPBCC domain-containing protein [Polyangia bacterium]
MAENLAAEADVTIRGSLSQVWDALVNPDKIKRYMFGATVESEWQVGGPIVWRGQWKGKPFEDKGRILEIQRQRRLRYSHFSPLSGAPDRPENYHTVTIQMDGPDGAVHVELSQDHNPTEEAREESRRNWTAMLGELKKTVEAES